MSKNSPSSVPFETVGVPQGAGTSRGLFRAVLGDSRGTIQSVFDRIERPDSGWPSVTGAYLDASSTLVDWKDARSSFRWHFMRLGHDVLVITTQAQIGETRVETVKGEGFVEMHFLLEGPVSLGAGVTIKPENQLKSASLMCCRQAEDLDYQVLYGPGTHLKASIYVRPEFLKQQFDFPVGSESTRGLLETPADLFTMLDARLSADSLITLRNLETLEVSGQRDLMKMSGLIIQLLGQSVDCVELATQDGESAQTLSSADVRMIEDVREYLQENLGDKLTLADLAKQMGTNTTKLKSGFKLLNGTTIHKYRTDVRMEHALRRLQENDGSVAVIGHAVGYERQASFSSAFKSYYGVPPKFAHKVRQK